MIPVKTHAGQQVLKDRSVTLTPRQRAVFILVDGKRSIDDILQATAAAGVTREDLDRLFELGLVVDSAPAQIRPVVAAPARSPQERYAAAYPIATRLTAIVAMTDSGGSSRRLMDEFGRPLPLGDLRQALVALSRSSTLWRNLFSYRFPAGANDSVGTESSSSAASF